MTAFTGNQRPKISRRKRKNIQLVYSCEGIGCVAKANNKKASKSLREGRRGEGDIICGVCVDASC